MRPSGWEPKGVFVRHTGMHFRSQQQEDCRERGRKYWVPVTVWEEREFLVDVVGLGEVVERPRGGLDAVPGFRFRYVSGPTSESGWGRTGWGATLKSPQISQISRRS